MNYWRFKMLWRIAERQPRPVPILPALVGVLTLLVQIWAAVRSVGASIFTRPWRGSTRRS